MGVDDSNDNTVTTGVDTLLSLLQKKKKIGLDEASKELKISQEVLQTWVDFLVEERIIGTEYKFTKPYIYLNEQTEATDKAKSLTEAKMAHFDELRRKGISEEEGEYIWKDKMLVEIKKHKEYFFKVAEQKKLENTAFLWEKFVNKMIK